MPNQNMTINTNLLISDISETNNKKLSGTHNPSKPNIPNDSARITKNCRRENIEVTNGIDHQRNINSLQSTFASENFNTEKNILFTYSNQKNLNNNINKNNTNANFRNVKNANTNNHPQNPVCLNIPKANTLTVNPINRNQYTNPNDKVSSDSKSENASKAESEEEEETEYEEIREGSYILKCIKNRKLNEFTDKDILGNIYTIATNLFGLRYLLEKIQENPDFANCELYPEIDDILTELICDNYGSNLIIEILDLLTNDKLNHFIKSVKFFIYKPVFFI